MENRRKMLVAMILVLAGALTLSGCLGSSGSVNKFELTVGVEGQGSVDPRVGKHEYTKARTVDLEATPAEDWSFSHWVGPVAESKSPSTRILVDGTKSVTAVFVKIEPLGEPVAVESGKAITFEQGIGLDLQEIEVPADAKVTISDVQDEVEIGLPESLRTAGAAVSVVFDAGENLDFSKGVTLRLPVSELGEEGRVGIFHKVESEWEYQPTTIEDGFVTAVVTSFSTYAVLEADVVEAPSSSEKETYLKSGTSIPLSTKTEGAQIYVSETSADYPGDFTSYEEGSLVMSKDDLTFYAIAVKENMIHSEIKRFDYKPVGIVVTVVDSSGNGVEDVQIISIDGSEPVFTDSKGIARVELRAIDTIVYPVLLDHSSEPAAKIAQKGDSIKFVVSPTEGPLIMSKTELTFNPVVFDDESRLNPFASSAIREAMNRFVNREHLVDLIEVDAVPLLTFIDSKTFEYEFMEDVMKELEGKYAYDKEAAAAIINAEMERMGAELVGGKWHYKDQVVELVFIIRSEDGRIHMGDHIADELESIGFAIERKYMTSGEASPIWLEGDPKAGLWHLYTGGWTSGGRGLQGHQLSQFYTPSGMPASPLWQSYDPPQEFLDVVERLYYNRFDSVEERRETLKEGLELTLEYSVRIWLTIE